ncbi:AT-rich interactive domain-containing protein 5B, partial [Pseudolycoriella hygida]
LHTSSKVAVVSYSRYCRYRGILKRLEDESEAWLANKLIVTLGGFVSAGLDAKIMFCRQETFDYPEVETLELVCNHLAPKLKGRPRGRRKKVSSDSPDSRLRGDSPCSESAGSEISAC